MATGTALLRKQAKSVSRISGRHHVAGFYSYGLESIGNGVDIGAEIAPRRGLGAGSAGAVEIDTREDLAVGAVNFRAVARKIGEYIGHK